MHTHRHGSLMRSNRPQVKIRFKSNSIRLFDPNLKPDLKLSQSFFSSGGRVNKPLRGVGGANRRGAPRGGARGAPRGGARGAPRGGTPGKGRGGKRGGRGAKREPAPSREDLDKELDSYLKAR